MTHHNIILPATYHGAAAAAAGAARAGSNIQTLAHGLWSLAPHAITARAARVRTRGERLLPPGPTETGAGNEKPTF